MPIPNKIIDRVHFIAEKQKCPDGLTFTRMDGTPILINDNDDDEEGEPAIENNELETEAPQLDGVDELAPEVINEEIQALEGEDQYMDAVQELGDVAMDGDIINNPDE